MLTARKMFSVSFAASAVRAEETRTVREMTCVVESLREVAGNLVDAADDFRGVGGAVVLVAGVLTLGGEGQEEVGAAAEGGGAGGGDPSVAASAAPSG